MLGMELIDTTVSDMKELKPEEGKILASYVNENFVISTSVYAKSTYDFSVWKEFNNEEEAREYYNVPEEGENYGLN